jgi:hypothetical protein
MPPLRNFEEGAQYPFYYSVKGAYRILKKLMCYFFDQRCRSQDVNKKYNLRISLT